MADQQVSKVTVLEVPPWRWTNHDHPPAYARSGHSLAIDVAKTRNEVLIEVPSQRRRRLTVLNTRTEHDRLIALLSGFRQAVTCGFEATGNYHRSIAWRLMQAGFEGRLVSSLALARTREALHNGWDKNDPKDAQVILHMLRIGATQHYHDPLMAGVNDLQELSKTHEAISKARPPRAFFDSAALDLASEIDTRERHWLHRSGMGPVSKLPRNSLLL